MFNAIKNIFRKKALKKFSSPIPTGMLPLSQIHSAVAFIDVEDNSFDDCKENILAFFKANNIKGDIFFFDFRKISNDDLLITNIQTTILRKDLNWFGKPYKEKMDLLEADQPDLFISLIKGNDYPITFMAAASTAKFKIGRKQSHHIFDLIVSDPKDHEASQLEIFLEMKKLFNQIG